MKPVILSADGPRAVYMVPDEVADKLYAYCLEFCNEWLPKSPDAAKYRVKFPDGDIGLRYCEAGFIEYLNTWIFPDRPSWPVEGYDCVRNVRELPPEYRGAPSFNF